ncbi:MAG TPA: NAD(P)-dependent oxidoreductase [Chloroflexota bacterium]|nr:NAD(P)-dependent oxidoreductase [Chloroflexota bacterium]
MDLPTVQLGQRYTPARDVRILVTGITGRIGANLAAALVAQGHAVRGLVWARDARVEKLEGLGVELVYGSLTEADDVRRAVAQTDAIYHLGGAFQGGGPFTTDEYFEINVRGTYLVLEACRALGDSLRHLLFASTDALYDKYVPGGMTEPIDPDRTPRRPRGWYALSKSLGEELCSGYVRSFRMPITILRFALVVGAGEIADFHQFYLSRLKETHKDLTPLWQESDGEERLVVVRDERGRSWRKHVADVRDIVGACVAALGKRDAFGETFQLAGPAPFTWDDAVPYLSRKLGIPYVEGTTSSTPTYYEYDLTKLRRLTGYAPQYAIHRMIDDAVAFKRGEEIGVLPTR